MSAYLRRGVQPPSPWTLGGLILFWLLTSATVYPLIWLVTNALKTSAEMFEATWALPRVLHWENFVQAWDFGIQRYLLNSVIVTLVSVSATVFLSALAAFALVTQRFRAKRVVYVLILGGLILPPEVSLFPLFEILNQLGVYNTYAALILPYIAFGAPFTTFLIRAYMTSIPWELNEAARIDGAGPLRIFLHVYLPLCRPVLASAALIQAMRVWNEFIFALTFVESERLKTMTVGLMGFANALRADWAVLLAGLVISVIPILVLFLVLQRQFISGLTQGAVK